MINIEELILYRDMPDGDLLPRVIQVLEAANDPKEPKEAIRSQAFICLHDLVELAGKYGFWGNLWQDYLTLLLINDENVFSTSCEIRKISDGSLLTLAKHDYAIFMNLFTLDFSGAKEKFGGDILEEILNYRGTKTAGTVFGAKIRDEILALCKALSSAAAASDLEGFTGRIIRFYQEYGVGKFGLHKAFRVEHKKGGAQIFPITNIADVQLEDLVGLELQKQKLIENTEAFLDGKPANNCLLFGDAGTGKSSSIKGILNRYYDRGLRMIELYKHQFKDLNDVIAQIKSRNYRFIIYMDDLSFEEDEVEYKYLKAVIEGGLEKKPENVLIYATSNRRHLIRERFSDNVEPDIGKAPESLHATGGGDLHISDTVQEKMSLSSRFGVTIYFGSPDPKEFQEIVRVLAKRADIRMPEDELLSEANKWELSHGGLSGRTATQFIDYLAALQ